MSVSAPPSTTTEFIVKIDGSLLKSINQDLHDAVEEIVVDENIHLPAMATLRFHMNNLDWIGPSTKLMEGKALEISASQHKTLKPLFKGTISGIELDLDEQLPYLTVRAYDNSFKLHRIIHRRAFIQMTDSDLARRLAQEAGLSVQADATSQKHEYIFQNNVSNYQFLFERARWIGYDFYCEDGTLYFKKPDHNRGGPTTLTWGEGLRRFRTRLSTFEPPDEVTVRGWDPKSKREIVGRATSARALPQTGISGTPAARSSQTWNSAKFFVTDHIVQSQGEADVLAQSHIDELAGSFIEAEGTCDGNPEVRPGRKVKLDAVGDRYNGTYRVTAARQIYTSNGHETVFTVTSRRRGTVDETLNGTRPLPSSPGPVIGIVTDINDPEKQGRIKVKYPWLADDQSSHWARIATPLSGNERGFHFLPEVNDEVLVMHEQNDPFMRRPIIIGCLYNGKDKVPVPPALPRGRDSEILKGGGAKVKQRLIKSTVGNMLIFNDDDSNPGVYMVGKSGAFIMIDDKSGDEIISIKDKTRNNSIEIHSKDNSIHVKCEGKAEVIATGDVTVDTKANLKATVTGNADVTTQGNMTLKATGNINIEATGNLTLKGMTSTVEAVSNLTLKGINATMQGTAKAEVSSNGPTDVRGTTVGIQGTAMARVSAPAVSLG